MNQELLSPQQIQQIKDFCPSWKILSDNQIVLQRLTGITNITMRASHDQDIHPKEMIVRKFGKAEECIYLDREREDTILQFLSSQKLGPSLYGFNKQIRLEEFIPSKSLESSKTLDDDTLVRIGCQLQKFHSLKPDFLDKTPLMKVICTNPKYLNEAQLKWNKPIYQNSELEILQEVKKWLCVSQLTSFSEQLQKLQDDVVFSHNDLLIGNILVKPNKDILFIDYQYSCYNYRLFDFGNYFLESMYDYDVKEPPYFSVKENLPEEKYFRRMIGAYLIAGIVGERYEKGEEREREIERIVRDQKESEEFILKEGEGMEEKIRRMVRGTLYHMMSSCVFWGIWSIYMAKNPDISFNYISFCKSRRDLYYRIKADLQSNPN